MQTQQAGTGQRRGYTFCAELWSYVMLKTCSLTAVGRGLPCQKHTPQANSRTEELDVMSHGLSIQRVQHRVARAVGGTCTPACELK